MSGGCFPHDSAEELETLIRAALARAPRSQLLNHETECATASSPLGRERQWIACIVHAKIDWSAFLKKVSQYGIYSPSVQCTYLPGE